MDKQEFSYIFWTYMLSVFENILAQSNVLQKNNKPSDEKRVIACALMLEVGLADGKFSKFELEKISCLMMEKWSIEALLIDEFIVNTKARIDRSISLFEFTNVVNKTMTYSEKYDLILSMWEIAFLDDDLDKFEEYIIRKVANLVYLTHADFIRSKISAKEISTKSFNKQ